MRIDDHRGGTAS